ncbi:MAG: glycosyltransferase family 2 protein [Clostridium sp.]|nr:glycosyltransferase family 2 protein [Clostridium sp.]
MKQRIFNTFYRITKNKTIANILTFLGYSVLLMYYYIARIFLRKGLNISKEEAFKKVNEVSKKPIKKYTLNKRIIDENIDLSIIVPAYNVSEFIEECINSVLKQKTEFKYELIVINDGSKDDTLDKINLFKEDSHLKIINQENRGFSGARNRGIDEAKGKYIMFLDSDDLLCENSIEKLMKTAYDKKADIVQGAYYTFDKNGNKFYTNIEPIEIDRRVDNKEISVPGFPWGKVYRAQLFEKVRFPLDFWYEDTIVNYLLARLSNKYIAISDYIYGYRINEKGITFTSKKSKKVLDTYWIIEEMINLSKEIGLKVDDSIYDMTVFQLSNLLYRRIHSLDDEVIKNTFILSSYLMKDIGIKDSKDKSIIFRDIEKTFKTQNYKLWKLASFVI